MHLPWPIQVFCRRLSALLVDRCLKCKCCIRAALLGWSTATGKKKGRKAGDSMSHVACHCSWHALSNSKTLQFEFCARLRKQHREVKTKLTDRITPHVNSRQKPPSRCENEMGKAGKRKGMGWKDVAKE